MIDKVFFEEPNDKGLSILLKREANIILASLNKNSSEYVYKKERFEETLRVVKAIENTDPTTENEINFILNTISNIWNISILSPLTLDKEEFLNYSDENGYFHNSRYDDIYIDNNANNQIYNNNAFNIYVRAVYNNDNNIQVECKNKVLYKNHRIYISKGGIVTGEYIEQCIIRKNVVDKHCFVIKTIPNIPVCKIIDKTKYIYVVDHREPKLKELQQLYNIPVNMDDFVYNKHYNIRKYIKLDKK